MKRLGAPIAPANWKSKEMPKAKETAGIRGMQLPSLFAWEKGVRGGLVLRRCDAAAGEEYIFHHPLPQMDPFLLRKEARGGGVAATS